MGKRAWWLGAVAILVVLPIGALGTMLAIVDPNDYKPQIAAAVQEATGRTLTLNGPVRISRSLWPIIEVSDVRLANLPGGTRADMAWAERIDAQLSLPALLWRRIEVGKLTLIGPNILFEQVGGKPNWVFTPNTMPKPAPSGRFGPSTTLRFRNVHVQNGMITLRTPARTSVVGIRSLDLQHRTDDGPLNLSTILVYADYQPFSLRASARPTAGVFGPWDTQLNFAAYDATASAEGMVNLAGDYNVQIEANAPALEKLNALLPQMRLPALHQARLSTHLTNGPMLGSMPVIGATQLHFDGADLNDRLPGVKLGAVDVSLPDAGALATVSGVGSFAGQDFKLGGTFGVPEHPDGRVKLPIDVTAQAQAKGNLSLRGNLALNTGHFDGLDANAALRTPALAAFDQAASRTLPPLTDVSFAGRLVVPADFGSLTLRDAKLSAHEGDLAGDATISLKPAMALQGKLHSTRLDMDALLTPSGITPTTPAGGVAVGQPSGPMISDAALPWSVLRGPAMDITADVAATTFRRQVWPKANVALQLKDGRMHVSQLQLALPGGPLRMSLTIDASTDNAPVGLTLQAPAVPLALVARFAELPGPVSGAMQLDAQLRAVGRSAHDLAASLDGSLAATMTGGSLTNAALIKLASAPLEALSVTVPAQGETAIRCLGLIGSFSKGVGRFRTIAVNTTYLKLDGVGQVDLAAETVAFKLHPMAQLSGSSVAVPVLVEGPFRAVQGRLDADGLDKLGLLIDAWFGGDQPQMCADAGLVPLQAPRP